MDAKKMPLIDFFDGTKIFTIPVYQRKYDWQQEHCQQFFSDIERIIQNDREHFLGTFVYQVKPAADGFGEYIIIDGQQRITSIILFAKSLFEFANDDILKEDILVFIKNLQGRRKGKCKLKPTEYDLPIFEKLMSCEKFNADDFKGEQSSIMYKNFVFFREKILSSKYSMKEFYNALNNINIVGILLEQENPQEIFESLNSTGKDLTEADLIRNYLLMPLDYETQQDFYKKYWLEIEKLLRTSDNTEEFLVQYLITKRRSNSIARNGKNVHLTKNILYYAFKRYFEDNYLDNVENFLKDVCRYAKFYSKFIFVDDKDFENLSALEKKFFELTYQLEATSSPIILMYLYDKYDKDFFDEQTFIEFTDALISLTFRAKICKSAGITGQFAGNVIARLDKENYLDANVFWSAITFGKGKYTFPSDETFQKALRNDDLYLILRSAGCKYLLYTLEKNSPQAKEVSKDTKATVEHILPQRLSANWKNYLEIRNDLQAHELLLHKLGNLTLTAYNSEISNYDFESKKRYYADSGFFYTRELKNFVDWTSAQIQIRSKKLANAALKIWKFPEKYQTAEVSENNFTLDDDLDNFTGKKPESIFISNTEIKVKNWRDLFKEVLNFFYSLDEDIFQQAMHKENIPQRVRKNFGKSDLRNVYLDASSIVSITKRFVENFDSIGGTNFKDDIWFTLKK